MQNLNFHQPGDCDNERVGIRSRLHFREGLNLVMANIKNNKIQ